MTRYHINPKTDNPGLCRAKIKCPFGDLNSDHYDSKVEAQKAYEKTMEYSTYSYKNLLFKRAQIHSTILAMMEAPDHREAMDKIRPLVDDRNKIDDLLKEYDHSKTEDEITKTSNKIYNITVPDFQIKNNTIIGWHNNLTTFKNNFQELDKSINDVTREWTNRLTNKELSDLLAYANDSTDYAKTYNDKEDFNKNFNNIVDKAPLISPIKVYSGVNYGTREAIVEQLRRGDEILNIDRVISTSLNPAQANGFMRNSEDDDYGNIALEISTNKGAFMQVLSPSADEFEVLVSRGEFRITNIQKNIELLWSGDGLGRTANTLISLEKINK